MSDPNDIPETEHVIVPRSGLVITAMRAWNGSDMDISVAWSDGFLRAAYLGTITERDYLDHFRRPGERVPSSRASLTADQVRLIRARYNDGQTITSLAAEFGVEASVIWQIVHSRTYKWVKSR